VYVVGHKFVTVKVDGSFFDHLYCPKCNAVNLLMPLLRSGSYPNLPHQQQKLGSLTILYSDQPKASQQL
jgi:hypothetical protein